MADNNINKNSAVRPYLGLNTDNNPVDQPTGTYRYALNATQENKEGDSGYISRESSFTNCVDLPEDYIVIGSVYRNNNSVILFLCSLDNTSSIIGILDDECNFSIEVESECLGFRIDHQIDATYRLRLGCEDTIYWVDGYNQDRYFNFAKPELFHTDAYNLYLQDPVGEFTDEKYNCDKFALNRSYTIPCFLFEEVATSGTLLSGSYNFAICYLDESTNPSNWIYTSQIVPIYKDLQTTSFHLIHGSSNYDSDPLGGTVGTTNKSIKLTLSGLDESYSYYKIAVIMSTSFTGEVDKVVVSPPIPINQETFLFDGNLSGYTETTIEEIQLKKSGIDYSNHIEQLENRLIRANLRGKQIRFCEFQQYASKIATGYVIREASANDQEAIGNAKNPDTYWVGQGYLGDEVYALGIVYVFKDGFESPAFHIPGRPLNYYWNTDTDSCEEALDDLVISVYQQDVAHLYPGVSAGDYNALTDEEKAKRWQVHDTSINYSGIDPLTILPEDNGNSYGAMQYHQNMQGTYEDRQNCDGNDYWGLDFCGNPITGSAIRHHRFPSRNVEPQVRGASTTSSQVGIYATITTADGITPNYPTDTYLLTVNYEFPIGVPGFVTYTIDSADDVPVFNKLLQAFTGSISDLVITSSVLTVTAGAGADTDFDFTISIMTVTEGDPSNGIVVRNLGIRFDNIEYPHPDVVGHYFVRAERDQINRTVLDKGIMENLRYKEVSGGREYIAFSYFEENNGGATDMPTHNYFFNPDFQYNGTVQLPQYIKHENSFTLNSGGIYGDKYKDPDHDAIWGAQDNVVIEVRYANYNYNPATPPNPVTGTQNYPAERVTVLDPISFEEGYTTIVGDVTLYNLSSTNKVQVIETGFGYTKPAGHHLPYCSLKVERDIHPYLESIVYQRMHNCLLDLDATQTVFGGDIFICNYTIGNSLIRRFQDGIGDAVWLQLATGGASGFHTLAEFLRNYDLNDLDELAQDTDLEGAFPQGIWNNYFSYANEYITGIYVESTINLSLKQSLNDIDCGGIIDPNVFVTDYFRDRWLTYGYDQNGENLGWRKRPTPCLEVYHYNKDFSRQNMESLYFPLSFVYDCCSDCLEEYPHRIIYSEQSFQEDLADGYRLFKYNNYRDIEGEHGIITDIWRFHNSLFVQTQEALWQLQPSIQERVTNDIVSFIGTGDLFSIPPRKVIDSDLGSVGTQHKWATVKVPQGVFTVSEIENKVFFFSNQGLDNISKIGLKREFRENLVDNFGRFFLEATGIEFPNKNNPSNPYGIGLLAGYDAEYERILLTKRDYLLLEDYIEDFGLCVVDELGALDDVYPVGSIRFDTAHNEFIHVEEGNIPINVYLTNTLYFENKSWTISYSLLSNSWVSYHSYIPTNYIFTHSSIYSTALSDTQQTIYKHNYFFNHCIFYGLLYPHIVELVFKAEPMSTKLWSDISVGVKGTIYDVFNKYWREERYGMFNSCVIYNSRQCTGDVNIVVKDIQFAEEDYLEGQINNIPGTIIAEKAEEDWNINNFQDYVDDYTEALFSKNWVMTGFIYPIDKVVNTNVINLTKDWTNIEDFRDKYLILRLIKADEDLGTKLLTKFAVDTSTISLR